MQSKEFVLVSELLARNEKLLAKCFDSAILAPVGLIRKFSAYFEEDVTFLHTVTPLCSWGVDRLSISFFSWIMLHVLQGCSDQFLGRILMTIQCLFFYSLTFNHQVGYLRTFSFTATTCYRGWMLVTWHGFNKFRISRADMDLWLVSVVKHFQPH